MKKLKTNVMMKNNTHVNNAQTENVESYINTGQTYSTRGKNQDKAIQKRITAGWNAFAKHGDIFMGNIWTCLKRQVYNSCLLPGMRYEITDGHYIPPPGNPPKGIEAYRKAGETLVRRSRQLLEGTYHLAEDSAR